VNAIRNWGEHSLDAHDPDSLRYLLEAADRQRLFAVHRIINGFEIHELIDVFNEFARSHRFPGRAIHLGAVAEALGNWSFQVQAKRIFEQFGQIVIPVDKGKHWVLAHGHDYENPGLLIDDPDGTCDRQRIEYKDVFEKGRFGILLLPSNSTLKFVD
jgi:hypothetical protein